MNTTARTTGTLRSADVSAPRNVDEYIAAASEAARPMLNELREAIRAAAPDADERISYGMPYYHLHGRLAYFQAHARHIGLYAFALEDARAVGSRSTCPPSQHFSFLWISRCPWLRSGDSSRSG